MTDDDLIAISAKYGVGPYSGLALAREIHRAALEEAAKSFELFFKRNDELDAGYVADSIRALSQKE
jgi:hypothetical protein